MGLEIVFRISGFTLLGLVVVGPSFGVSIADFVIADQANPCGNSALVSLYAWLIVNGAINLFVLAVLGALFLLAKSYTDGDSVALPWAIFVNILAVVFGIAWSVVGAVSLFRDSQVCSLLAKPVWSVTLASLIISWYTIVCHVVAAVWLSVC